MVPTGEEISICDAVARLAPGVDPLSILVGLRKDAENRRERIEGLRKRVQTGNYRVAPGAVAAAILLEGDILLQ